MLTLALKIPASGDIYPKECIEFSSHNKQVSSSSSRATDCIFPSPGSTKPRGISQDQSSIMNVIGFSPNKIEMTVSNNSKCDSWLLYLDAYAPDWKAYIDGKETDIYRGNIGFKAVHVSPGVHNVQMKYLPLQVMWSFGFLILIEVIGIFVMTGLLIRKAVEPLKKCCANSTDHA